LICPVNALLSISIGLATIPLGLKPATPDLTTRIVTYTIPALYTLITTTYTLINNENLKNRIKNKTKQTST